MRRIVPTLMKIVDRFKINSKSGCWEWTGPLNKDGYGKLSYWHRGKHYTGAASRGVFLAFNNIDRDVSPLELVCHKCNNKACINPKHLYLGTPSQNQLDCVAAGNHPNKSKTHCSMGHELNDSNVLEYKTNKGHNRRICRKCRNFYSWEAKKKSNYGARKWAKRAHVAEIRKLVGDKCI